MNKGILLAVFVFALFLVSTANAYTLPANTFAYVVFNFTNTQSSATPNPFQFNVTVNSSNYSAYENANLTNVEWANCTTGNGNITQSWLESGASNTSTNTNYWLNTSGWGGNSNITLCLVFGSPTSNFMSTTGPTGENPTLSATYGLYDNGQLVFPIYQNFSGPSVPSGWQTKLGSDGETITFNNGATLNSASTASSGVGAALLSTSTYTLPQVWDSNFSVLGPLGGSWQIYFYGLDDQSTGDWQSSPQNCVQYYFGGSFLMTCKSGSQSTSSWAPSTGQELGSVVSNTTKAWALQNYVAVSNSYITSNIPTVGMYFGWTASRNTGTNAMYVQWVRQRAFPPNGILPNASSTNLTALFLEQIIFPTNSTYYAASNLTSNYTQTTVASTFCADYLNGNYISNQTVPLNSFNGSNLNLILGLNNYTISCNGYNSTVYFDDFYGLNLTVLNSGNNTVLNGWNATAANSTFTNWTNAANSPFLWEQNKLPLNNSGSVSLNVSFPGYAQGNFSFNVTNNTLLNLSLGIWPLQYFYAYNGSNGAAINSFIVVLTNGANVTSCTATVGNCSISLGTIGLGNNTVQIVSTGFNTLTSYYSFNGSSSANLTYNLSTALASINVFDESTGAPLWFNLTVSNVTTAVSFTGLSNIAYLNYTQIPVGSDTFTVNAFNQSYQPRTYFGVFTANQGLNLSAYLLATGSGQFVTYNVQSTSGLAITSANATVERLEGGVYTNIAQQTADASGTVSFYLNPAVQYEFLFQAPGYVPLSFLQYPSLTQYTIKLAYTNSSYAVGTWQNVTGNFTPVSDTINASNSAQTITFTVYDPQSGINWYSLSLFYNGTTIFSQNVTGQPSGGIITATLNATQYYLGNPPVIAAVGQVSKANLGQFTWNDGWLVTNTTYGPYSLQAAFDLLTASPSGQPGIFLLGEVIVIAGVGSLTGEALIGAGVGLAIQALLTMAGAMGPNGWLIFSVCCLLVIALMYLRRII